MSVDKPTKPEHPGYKFPNPLRDGVPEGLPEDEFQELHLIATLDKVLAQLEEGKKAQQQPPPEDQAAPSQPPPTPSE